MSEACVYINGMLLGLCHVRVIVLLLSLSLSLSLAVPFTSGKLLLFCDHLFDFLFLFLSKDGSTPLYAAARHGHLDVIDFMFKNSRVNVNKPNMVSRMLRGMRVQGALYILYMCVCSKTNVRMCALICVLV